MEISSSEQTTGPLGVWDSAAPRLEHSDGHSFPSAQPRAGEIYQRVICRMRHATKTRAGCQRNGSASAWCHFERGKTFIWDDRTVDFIIYLYSLYMLHTCWMILFGLDWSLQTVHGPKAIKTRAPQSMPKSSHRVQMYITGILSFYPLCQYTPRWWVMISFGIPFGNATWLENPPFVGDFWWFLAISPVMKHEGLACPRYASAMDLIGDASSKKEWNPRVMRMAGSPERSWKHGITKKMAHLVDGSDRSTRPCAWNGWPKHQNMKSFQWPSVRPWDFETAISMFTAQKPQEEPSLMFNCLDYHSGDSPLA